MLFRVVIGEWPVLSISDSLSLQLCLFLCLNGDLDKRVWAAREQLPNTKRQSEREERERGQRGAGSQGQIYWAICTLFQTLEAPAGREAPVIYQTGALGSKGRLTVIVSSFSLPWVGFTFLLQTFASKGGSGCYMTSISVPSAGFAKANAISDGHWL